MAARRLNFKEARVAAQEARVAAHHLIAAHIMQALQAHTVGRRQFHPELAVGDTLIMLCLEVAVDCIWLWQWTARRRVTAP